ncbi:gluconate kinase (FGGY family) [Humibacillus xanthopallidus]|uniref:Gluconate kinase (FGGY family) n=1 Tax=Humibacillus xanthopallidus TaxID=412689 RepID=A0A543PTI5_9MICO|nr:gluconokinase [Humibacillus xanthopallidus]TQN47379.1 gluconate kinase (FGGY family) [Humibacillus xanthopallidus]
MGDARESPLHVIGVDVGTTAAKVVAFRLLDDAEPGAPSRPPVAVAVHEYPLIRPRSGWRVQDADVVVSATLTSLADCVAQLDGGHVVAVSVSTAMHGLIALDAEARPLTPIITWADARARDVARELRGTPVAASLHARSGTPVHSMSPLTKLRWFADNEPGLMTAATSWAGLKDVVLHALTGHLVTELSSASGTGLLSIAHRAWDTEAVALSGARLDQLPPVLPTTATLPLDADVARRVGLPAGTPVVVGAGDGPLGNLGTGAITPGVAGLSLGTSGALRLTVDEPWADPSGRLFCYALTDDRWVLGTPISNGGAVVRWAGSVFAAERPDAPSEYARPPVSDADLLALASGIEPGSEGLVMLPFLLAERGPLWDADLRGAYLGIRQHHTRAHFIRAAVEGVAFQLATILDGLDEVVPVTSIRATGGVFRSELWREVLSGVLGRPLSVTAGAEGSALGAAALGLHAIGAEPTLEQSLERLAPGLVGERADDDAGRVVAPEASSAAYRDARASAGARLRDLADAAALLAVPSGSVQGNTVQPDGNKRQLVVGERQPALH